MMSARLAASVVLIVLGLLSEVVVRSTHFQRAAVSNASGGSPRVRGTRISVVLILESLAAGMSIAQIVDAYPSLTEESVRGVLAELAHRKDLQPA